MRVLVILPNDCSYGGARRFLDRLLELHDRHNIETALLVPAHFFDNYLEFLATYQRIEIFSAANKVRGNTTPVLTPFFDFLFSWRTVRSWRPDLVVVSTRDPGRMSIALYFPLPAVYILHTIPEAQFGFLPRLYLRIGSLLNNAIMTVSRAAAEKISKTMGFPMRKISIVYNSCQPVHNHSTEILPVVVTAGHLVPYKNPDVWLKVAQVVIQQRLDITFVWVGDGELLTLMRQIVNTL